MDRVTLVRPARLADSRGWFSETWTPRLAARHGIAAVFVQDNHSLSREAGTIRGFHFQAPPRAQAKLVRCVRGRIRDVALDIRRGSPTFGRHVAAELTAENGLGLFIPVGFAHAFVTLEPDTEVIYKVSDVYAPETESGCRWDVAGLFWPVPATGPILSDKDAALPPLARLETPFAFDGEPLAAEPA